MQKHYPQDSLTQEWEDRTGEPLIMKDWGNLMESLELQTRLMERGLWMDKPIDLKEEDAIPDEDMLADPIDLMAHLT